MAALCITATPLAAARAARRLCDAEGGVLLGPAVTTLDRLVPSLLAEAGERRPILTSLAARILAAEAGRDAGGPLAGIRPGNALCAGLASAIGELRASGIAPEVARAAAASLGGAAAVRLGALASALASFEERLDRLGALDRAAALSAAVGLVRRGAVPSLRKLDLLVADGLGPLDPADADLLVALAGRARRARIDLGSFGDRPDLSLPLDGLLRRLEAEAASAAGVEIVHRSADDDRAPRLAALVTAFAGGAARLPDPGAAGRVAARVAAGEDGEPDEVARAVQEMVDLGIEPGNVAVVAPAPRRLAAPLARALAERGIPFAAGRGAPLGDAAPVCLVQEALAAAASATPARASVERLAASTYLAGRAPLGPQLDAAGAVDGRVAPSEALRRRREALSAPSALRARAATARAEEAALEVDRALRPLAAPGTAREHAARLTAFLDASGLRRRAGRGPRATSREDLVALSRLEEAAEGVARAQGLAGLGRSVLTASGFAELLAVSVRETALPPGPEPAAGAVELWGLDEAPGLSARGVVIAGCGAAWPPAPPPEPVLRDPERVAIARQAARAVLPVSASRRAEARLRALAAVAAAREAVSFTWGVSGPAGRGGDPSPLVAEALLAVGSAVPAGPASEPGISAARTEREALRAVSRSGDPSPLAGTALVARAASALARAAVERERREGRPGPHAGRVEGAALDVLRAALPASWSPSQLERYAECPFRLFLGKHVRLPDEAAADLDPSPRDEGTLLHRALELLVRARIARGQPAGPPPSDCAALQAELAEAADAALASFEAEGRAGDPAVWAGRRGVLLSRLERHVLAEAARADALVPVAVEHRFGGASGRAPLEVSAGGETVLVEGRIDRLDASPGALRVVDYKSGRAAAGQARLLDTSSWGVSSFQAPAYLLAAARDLPGRTRLEARYAFLRTATVEERAYAIPPGATAPEGAEAFSREVVALVRRMRAGDHAPAPDGCERCPWPAVCRPERTAAAEEAP
ncbi:MAG TPA: PD-(D/E)XK nuclease family protein [Anaeromyxobacteraceae bacterium]|nr:PD-(D/E)XK nuclease family protein [Anaeromyxobacteraceae bacterium]